LQKNSFRKIFGIFFLERRGGPRDRPGIFCDSRNFVFGGHEGVRGRSFRNLFGLGKIIFQPVNANVREKFRNFVFATDFFGQREEDTLRGGQDKREGTGMEGMEGRRR
jgi:hypothetical protein